MPLYRCEGVVLRTYELGEADRIVVLYTREYGKKRTAANGVRRPRSSLKGSVLLFAHSEFLIYEGRSLDKISQGDLQDSFPALREDFKKMAYASYGAELVDTFVEPDEGSGPLFELLLNFFRLLSASEEESALNRIFELKLMELLGYRPHLDDCLFCGRILSGVRVLLSVDQGGVVCKSCRKRADSVHTVPTGALQVLKNMQKGGFSSLRVLHMDPDTEKQIRDFLRRYIDYRLERGLKSLAFLDMVEKEH